VKPQVYVAGPFRGTEALNARRAIVVGQHLRDTLGVVVRVPHLSILEDMIRPRHPDYWLESTMDEMRCCDAVYRISGKSAGSDAECTEADRLGIPVFTDARDLKQWADNWKERNATDSGTDSESSHDSQGIENDHGR
jgi:hypothetical protein